MREMLVMNFSADISAVYEVLGANRVVSPNGSAAKKATIPVSTQSNTPASKTSMLGTISLPRVVDDAASKGSGSDIPSHSSASSQDELVRHKNFCTLDKSNANDLIVTFKLCCYSKL